MGKENGTALVQRYAREFITLLTRANVEIAEFEREHGPLGSECGGNQEFHCTRWMVEYLSSEGGSVLSSRVLVAGHERGFGERAIRLAKRHLGVRSIKSGLYWFWGLPAAQDKKDLTQGS